MKRFTVTCLLAILAGSIMHSCTTIDLYEKTQNIPDHEWKSSFRPSFEFDITDTTSSYQVYFIIRHKDLYNFNNIYLNLYVKGPGQDTARRFRQDLQLATNDKGWLGEGMDDIYEHRVKLGEALPLRKGKYQFTLEQIMREDPLLHVLQAGVRVEKIK